VLVSAVGQVSTSRPADPPTWASRRDHVPVFVRSFAGETADATFEEPERRVPIESLGVDCLWLTPIAPARPTTATTSPTSSRRPRTSVPAPSSESLCRPLSRRRHPRGLRPRRQPHQPPPHPAFQLHSWRVEAYAIISGSSRGRTTRRGLGRRRRPEFYFNWARIPNVNYDSLAVRGGCSTSSTSGRPSSTGSAATSPGASPRLLEGGPRPSEARGP